MPGMRMTTALLLVLLASPCTGAVAASRGRPDVARWLLGSPAMNALPPAPIADAVTASTDGAAVPTTTTAADDAPKVVTRLRQLLADFSMTLRDIRYRRGGHDPKTGFDCSGFVRYVFHHSVGADLPNNSASQFRSGTRVARGDMQVGDLVFFRTRGKRVSHVGIYLGDGRFIHSPSTGKRVSISHLDEAYWSRRFVGAKRPSVLT